MRTQNVRTNLLQHLVARWSYGRSALLGKQCVCSHKHSKRTSSVTAGSPFFARWDSVPNPLNSSVPGLAAHSETERYCFCGSMISEVVHSFEEKKIFCLCLATNHREERRPFLSRTGALYLMGIVCQGNIGGHRSPFNPLLRSLIEQLLSCVCVVNHIVKVTLYCIAAKTDNNLQMSH